MTQITEDHVEWAVVNRLQKLLVGPMHQTFNVTHTYALFVLILCWTMQRLRAGEGEGSLREAAKLLRKLDTESIVDEPWSVRERQVALKDGQYPDVQSMCAKWFLIGLRNAVAHGDARKVSPVHQKIKGAERELVGFSFGCDAHSGNKRNNELVWKGTVTLYPADMRRIGNILADRFCTALRREHSKDNTFRRDAVEFVIEKAA